MPIYEYQCKKCKNIFEYFHVASNDKNVACPECNSKRKERVISTSVQRPKGFPASPKYEFPSTKYPDSLNE